MSEPLLSVDNLVVHFPRGKNPIQAVRGVSWTIREGEILGIVGESGSGKSVSTSAIPSLLPAHARVSGSIRYRGVELLGRSTEELRQWRGKKIGMIYQEPARSYDPLYSMERVFLETFRNSVPDIDREEARLRAITLLTEVGLSGAEDRLGNYPHQFSGGQLQRIGIALALAQGCELLIADEPTTALDVTIQAHIVALLKRIRESRRIAIIFISHNIDLVSSISDRLLVMYGGLVVEEGDSARVLGAPTHPYTRSLLKAAPAFDAHYSTGKLASIPGRVPDPAAPEPGCPFAPRCRWSTGECKQAVPELTATGGATSAGKRTAYSDRRRCIFDPESLQ